MENKIYTLDTEVIQRVVNRNAFYFGFIANKGDEPELTDDLDDEHVIKIDRENGYMLAVIERLPCKEGWVGNDYVYTYNRNILAKYIGNGKWEVSKEILLTKFA